MSEVSEEEEQQKVRLEVYRNKRKREYDRIIEKTREALKTLYKFNAAYTPNPKSRELEIVKIKLQEALMWLKDEGH